MYRQEQSDKRNKVKVSVYMTSKGRQASSMEGFKHIADNRMLHIRAVAEECYRIAIEEYHLTQSEAEKAYTIGFVHDIGYAFADESKSHPLKGMEMLNSTFNVVCLEVGAHGIHDAAYQSQFLDILNKADLIVNAAGKKVGPVARLADIAERYGKGSEQYKNAEKLAKRLFCYM